MGGRGARVSRQWDGWTGLQLPRQALCPNGMVASSESSLGISADPLNMSQGNERVGPDECQCRGGRDEVTGEGTKERKGIGLMTAVARRW